MTTTATPTPTTQPLALERETCSRCGGSGHYSYCQMHGTVCFKCGGSGKQLTKRGAAANRWLAAKRTIKGADVQLGMWLRVDGVPGFSRTTCFKVETMYTTLQSGKSLQRDGTWKEYHHLVLEGTTPKGEQHGLHTFPDADVRRTPTKAEAREQLQAAIMFQDTLTQAGTPRKR